MQLHRLTARLALSGCIRYYQDMRQLAEAGVTHIIGFFSDDDRCWETDPRVELSWATDFHIMVHRINRADDARPWEPELIASALCFAREALRDPGAKLLVHCMAGVCRSPVMAYGVLRQVFGMESETARRIIEPLLAPDRTRLHEVHQASMEAYLGLCGKDEG
jgi:predicted protein tyrosine phosphatase